MPVLDEHRKSEAIPRHFKRHADSSGKFQATAAARFSSGTRCYHRSDSFSSHAMPDLPSGTPAPDPHPDTPPPTPRPATLGEVLNAVLWSFFGVRKGDAMRRDAATIKPHQVIVVGVLSAAVLVVVLLILVRLITRNA